MKLEDFEGDRCAWCNKPFEARAHNHLYCCVKCEIASRPKWVPKPLLTITCPCGTEFQTRRSFQKYCCIPCARRHQRKFNLEVISEERRQARADRTCAHCGKPFDAVKGFQRYCSHACNGAAGYDRKMGRKLKDVLAELRCHDCGGPIPDAIRTDRLYCRACQRKRKRRELAKMLERKATQGIASRASPHSPGVARRW